MKNYQPLVSIVIPTYNVAEYLADCIRSIEAQTHKNLEVIIVDDGSTDSTPTLLKYYQQKNSKIKVIQIPHVGIAKARNTGIEASSGEYVAVMDSDDIMYQDRLKIALQSLEKSKADVFYSAYYRGNERMEIVDGVMPAKYFSKDKTSVEEILATQIVPHVTIVAKRKCFIENPYRNDLKVNDDMGLVLDWWKANYKFCMSKYPLVLVRFHSHSTSATKDKEVRAVTAMLRQELIKEGYLNDQNKSKD